MFVEDLAKMIARDGEGATKLIEVEVQGAITDEEARKIAKTVVGSPLSENGGLWLRCQLGKNYCGCWL